MHTMFGPNCFSLNFSDFKKISQQFYHNQIIVGYIIYLLINLYIHLFYIYINSFCI